MHVLQILYGTYVFILQFFSPYVKYFVTLHNFFDNGCIFIHFIGI